MDRLRQLEGNLGRIAAWAIGLFVVGLMAASTLEPRAGTASDPPAAAAPTCADRQATPGCLRMPDGALVCETRGNGP